MTAVAIGTLVDEGKLDWDTPVVRYMPGFELYDAMLTSRVTPRDLAAHKVGVPDHWFLWYGNDGLKRSDLLARLRFLEPNHDLRTVNEYNTLMIVALGEMGARVAGAKNAETLVEERVWKPLGMTQSNWSVHTTQKSPDFAQVYRRVEGKIERAQFRDQDVVGPGGSVNSTAEDMARFLVLETGATIGGHTVIAPATLRELHQQQHPPTSGSIHPELTATSYGLGHHVRTYRGHRMASHSGGIDGVSAHYAVMPDDRIGVVVLSNLTYGDNMMPIVLSNTILDRMIGASPIDWQKIYWERATREWKAADDAAAAPMKWHDGTKPSHALVDFVGGFENPAYGNARIEVSGGALRLVFHGAHPLDHVHYDVFAVAHDRRDDFDRMRLVFRTNADGDVESFTLPLEPATKPIVFTRGVDRSMANAKFLAPCIAEYQFGPGVVKIVARGDTAIAAILPSGIMWRLVPVRGTTFAVEGQAGMTLEFLPNALVIHEPGADRRGARK